MSLPVAIDAMGGDNAPEAIVAGACLAADKGIAVALAGPPAVIEPLLGGRTDIAIISASEVSAMDDDPGKSVRTKKDASMVRAAEAVRDGNACAFVGAGNTGATMASALLRIGRIKGYHRPAIATGLPILGGDRPNILLDAGANAECTADMLGQFARMGAIYARARFGVETPKVGLLSIGEEAGKGSPLVKEAYQVLDQPEWQQAVSARFVGNVEGRDLFDPSVDVIVTDGFTGNVALKTAEGVSKMIIDGLFGAFDASDEAREGAKLLTPALLPMYNDMNPDAIGGAMLLGLKGVCVISHGASSPKAILSAIELAKEVADRDMVGSLTAAANL